MAVLRDMTRGQRIVIVFTLLLVLLVGAGNLAATFIQNSSTKNQFQQAQVTAQKAGKAVEQKICSSFEKVAALKPPGDAGASAEFERSLHQILSGIPADIQCQGLAP